MKGRLALINLALAALVALGGWQLREKWRQARAREIALYRQQVKPAAAPLLAPIPAAEPVAAMTYGDVAQKMLFSKDRNPAVEIDVAPPKPMPALPVVYGVMAFGDVRSAILGARAGAGHRAFAPGEMVGEFKLVSVDSEQLVFEWDGQTIVKRVEELMSKDRGQPAPSAPESAAAAPPPPPTTTTVIAEAP
ncbi:MAG: hypothetical protein HY822_22035, partial [Acidobacteria bacterium]|nr:hypothetical protein [Acidobacteriota bacterium]